MDLNRGINTSSCNKLSDAIKKDIVDTLRKKGVTVKKVNIDLKADLLNLSVSISNK